MRKSRFTEQQIIKVLKEHAVGLSASEVCRRYGIKRRDVLQVALALRGVDRLTTVGTPVLI